MLEALVGDALIVFQAAHDRLARIERVVVKGRT